MTFPLRESLGSFPAEHQQDWLVLWMVANSSSALRNDMVETRTLVGMFDGEPNHFGVSERWCRISSIHSIKDIVCSNDHGGNKD